MAGKSKPFNYILYIGTLHQQLLEGIEELWQTPFPTNPLPRYLLAEVDVKLHLYTHKSIARAYKGNELFNTELGHSPTGTGSI